MTAAINKNAIPLMVSTVALYKKVKDELPTAAHRVSTVAMLEKIAPGVLEIHVLFLKQHFFICHDTNSNIKPNSKAYCSTTSTGAIL